LVESLRRVRSLHPIRITFQALCGSKSKRVDISLCNLPQHFGAGRKSNWSHPFNERKSDGPTCCRAGAENNNQLRHASQKTQLLIGDSGGPKERGTGWPASDAAANAIFIHGVITFKGCVEFFLCRPSQDDGHAKCRGTAARVIDWYWWAAAQFSLVFLCAARKFPVQVIQPLFLSALAGAFLFW